MTWHIIFEKKYEPNSKEDVVATYHAISSELENITHPIQSLGELNEQRYMQREFLVPSKTPLAMVSLYGKLCTREIDTEVLKCIGMISLDIRHFEDKGTKFPQLEQIANNHGLTYIRTCKEYYRDGRNYRINE